MLCAMQYGVFLFFAGCVAAMTAFVYWLVPETKGVPMEEIYTVYAKHPFWGRIIGGAGEAVMELETARSASRQFARAEGGDLAGGPWGRGCRGVRARELGFGWAWGPRGVPAPPLLLAA